MEYAKYKLGDIVTFLNGRAYLMPELQDSGKYRILRVGNLSGGNDSWYYSDMELDENKYCEKGDLLYAWACNFGPHIWKEEKVIFHYHIWKLVEDKKKVDKTYLYYYLLHQTPFYLGGVNGATMVHITKKNMEKKTAYIPSSLEVQHRIASILSTYDTLIENNTKRIRFLEKMAENLYKEWFVRFRFPGHEKVEMENGLPKGWKIKRYEEVTEISAGGDKPLVCNEKQTEDCSVPIFSNGVDNDGLYGFTNQAKIHVPCITISARGTVGFVVIRRCPFVPIVRLLSVIPKNGLDVFYLYFSSRSNDLEGNGTSQQQLTVPMLKKRKLIIPIENIQKKFGERCSLLYEQMDILRKQNTLLARQRDLLLPRLMSGKLEV